VQRDGERVKTLRCGHVSLNDDEAGKEILASASADKWLEANVSYGARRFFLMDGDWFEIGADYVRASRDAISRLFPATPTISLPPWSLPERRTEYDCNCPAGKILSVFRYRLDPTTGTYASAGVHSGKMTVTEPVTITIDLTALL
jgi:uncharacterized protein (TIGR04141 family)